jgi:hypothetical protein
MTSNTCWERALAMHMRTCLLYTIPDSRTVCRIFVQQNTVTQNAVTQCGTRVPAPDPHGGRDGELRRHHRNYL